MSLPAAVVLHDGRGRAPAATRLKGTSTEGKETGRWFRRFQGTPAAGEFDGGRLEENRRQGYNEPTLFLACIEFDSSFFTGDRERRRSSGNNGVHLLRRSLSLSFSFELGSSNHESTAAIPPVATATFTAGSGSSVSSSLAISLSLSR
ncbi:hypothetical protein PIB30_026783 [Stylosanthes scabra]|uniref:Uncharacterized protein n=1 Tax=Stylosanthes scabra TaxID=79078 RepID=A0ABU6Y912_9FABA|nr:hypothetical protein [Stylosanthes scabra]